MSFNFVAESFLINYSSSTNLSFFFWKVSPYDFNLHLSNPVLSFLVRIEIDRNSKKTILYSLVILGTKKFKVLVRPEIHFAATKVNLMQNIEYEGVLVPFNST